MATSIDHILIDVIFFIVIQLYMFLKNPNCTTKDHAPDHIKYPISS